MSTNPTNPTGTTYSAGERVLISDGMSPWDPAVVLSGPHQPLTSEHPMYLVRAEDPGYGESTWLAYPAEMRKVSA
jgi:hypothetical protein